MIMMNLYKKAPINLYKKRIRKCLDLANEKYGANFEIPHYRKIFMNYEYLPHDTIAMGEYNEDFNHHSLMITFNARHHDSINPEVIINDGIPHELAHLICFKNKIREWAHGETWENLCKAMGGTGDYYIDY